MKLDTSVAPELALLTGTLDAPARGCPGPSPVRVPAAALAAAPAPAATAAVAGGSAGRGDAGPDSPATIGYLAACLRLALADPQRWWDLVRFDARRPARIDIPPAGWDCELWLLVLPPGHRGEAQLPESSWQVASLVAGAVSDQASTPGGWQDHPLSPGRTRVRGGRGPYRMINTGTGYAVTLHGRSVRPGPIRAV
jgi:hypothetical protein